MFKILYAVMTEQMPEGFEDNLVFAEGEYEIILFETAAMIEVEGELRAYPPHTGIIYKPGQRVHYKAESGELIHTWIRFDCDEPLFVEGYVPFGVPIYCENYDDRISLWHIFQHFQTDVGHVLG